MNINNINNESLVFKNKDEIYYSNISEENGGLYKKSLVTNVKEKILNGRNIKSIQIENKSLYYSSDYEVHKFNLETRCEEAIFSSEYFISFVVVINEKIYVNLSDENSSLLVKNLITGEEIKIAEDICGFNIYKKDLYYSGNEDFGIYKLDLESKEKYKIIDKNVMFPIINNDMLYYFEVRDKAFWELNLKTMASVKLDIELKEIGLRDINFYNILDNKLVFSSSGGIFKFNLDTRELSKIEKFYSSEINIINDIIYCSVYIGENDYIYRFKEDGTELCRL